MCLPAAPSAHHLLPSAKGLASTSRWALELRSPPPLFLWATLSSRLNQRDQQSEWAEGASTQPTCGWRGGWFRTERLSQFIGCKHRFGRETGQAITAAVPRDVSMAWGGWKRLCLAEGTAIAVWTPRSVSPESPSVSVQGVGVLPSPRSGCRYLGRLLGRGWMAASS